MPSSSPPSNPVYVRRVDIVDPSGLVFSLSSHRHSYIVLWNRSATLPDNERSHCATSEVQGIMVVLRRRITRQQNDRRPEQPTARYLLKRSEWLHPSFSLSRFFVHVNTCLSYPWSPYKTLRTEYATVLVLTGNPYRKAVAVD